MWRRTVEQELKNRGLTLQTDATAADRPKWRSLAIDDDDLTKAKHPNQSANIVSQAPSIHRKPPV
ncbi:hypothetical protein DPMN_086708 [Dreissena polymorpha]|uniref:Uncharacterized protein n=1 Tax=Dreissena polymorpha TaxID=45954 RepID=A0A9D4KRH9_DREPO|nr:hypothetical protein DPMN_086708 [Dreissena polymorpha]